MLGVAFCMLVMGVLFLVFANRPADSPEDHAARLSREYGLIVGFGEPSTFYTPPFGPKDANFEDVELDAAKLEERLVAHAACLIPQKRPAEAPRLGTPPLGSAVC